MGIKQREAEKSLIRERNEEVLHSQGQCYDQKNN